MKTAMLNILLGSLLALMPVAVSAQDKAVYYDVTSTLEGGVAPGEIINTLMDDYGVTLVEATLFAMMNGGEANREDFAVAGIEAADNLAQAQVVADAVKAEFGFSGILATVVDGALLQYAKMMPQPKVYESDYWSSGGPVSPAS